MNIGFFSSEKNGATSYLENLENKNFVLLKQDNENIASCIGMHAFVLDFSNEEIEDILSFLFDVVLAIRKTQNIPLFIIVDKATQRDRQLFLQLGVTGIFDQETDPREFSLIVSNILTADYIENTHQEECDKTKQMKQMKLIPENLAVLMNENQEIQLTKLEYKFLDYLDQVDGKAASYDELVQAVWNGNTQHGHARISNIVFHLRKKIEEDPSIPKYLKTIRGKGYRLNFSK